MSNILIEANNISKIYDPDIFLKRGKNFYALNNVNFVLEKGDFICIMGPSGSGKSTLLNCLSTLDTISKGHILLKGQDMSTLTKNQLCEFRYKTLGFVFQNHNLIPYLTIFDNIATPALLSHLPSQELKDKVLSIAKELEIEKILDKFPHECSGGECQRAAIARALINDPEVIFCDEPTGNLDSKNSHKVLSILSKLNQQGTTILLVTHDALIASYAQTMMYLYDGGIKTVIHRHHGQQMDFYRKINEIVAEDSLLREIVNQEQEPFNTQPIESIKIENKKKEFVSRQDVYIYIEGQQYDKDMLEKYTPFHIIDTKAYYRNKHNDDITIDLSKIEDISLNLSAQFLNFGIMSQYIFYVTLDMKSHEGIYQFKAMNKDDMIHIIQYFDRLHIPISDPRDIIKTYHDYPRDYERQKYYLRTHKDIINPKKVERINPITGKKI